MKHLENESEFRIVTLNKAKRASSILFIPGGPGMSAKCFEDFAASELQRYAVRGIDFKGNSLLSRRNLGNALKRALAEHPSDFVVGHSFGGMILLSTPGLEKLTKARIIISAAPNLKWRDNIANFRLTAAEESAMKNAESEFSINPNNKTLANLWKSWAPYYFTKSFRNDGAEWLARCAFHIEAFQSTQRLLKNYRQRGSIKVPTLYIGGARDKLTPVSAFKGAIPSNNYAIKTVAKAGHFPWIDASETLAEEIVRFIEAIRTSGGR